MSHDESLARTYEERKAARLAECGAMTPVELQSVRLAFANDEIRRLRRALKRIRLVRCECTGPTECAKCIATRALKGKK